MNSIRLGRQAYAFATLSRRCFSTTNASQAVYGFVGLGRMGYPMAKNLRAKLSSSDSMIIHDINTEATSRFANEESNVQVAENVRDVAEKAETIITVLPAPDHVRNVFMAMLKPPTLLQDGINQERLFLDCSTIDPKSSADVANAAHSSGQGKFIDAPMSGGVVGAESGTLTFMVGCPPELKDRAQKVLLLMGKRVIFLGPQTSGLKGKLANNYLLALNNIATAEAMNMGVRWGLDPAELADMINTSTGKCWPSEVNNPVPGVKPDSPASKDYAGGFGTALMNKDLKLAMGAAQQFGIEPRLGPMAASIYSAIEGNEKYKNKDFSVVYKYLRGE